MKHRISVILLSFVMVLTLLPMTARAEQWPPSLEAPRDLSVTYQTERDGFDYVFFTYTIPESIKKIANVDFRIEIRENEGPWVTADSEAPETYLDPMFVQSVTGAMNCAFYRYGEQRRLALSQNNYEFRACFAIGNMARSPYSNLVSLGYKSDSDFKANSWSKCSAWAQEFLERADYLDLIPPALMDTDMTAPITRAEFAAVAVRLYETLAQTKIPPSMYAKFSDTDDLDVRKAYTVGFTSGTSETTFSPNEILTREQAATMLMRVLKKFAEPEWTPNNDDKYPIHFTMPPAFADDAQISDWAKQSVYFMAANGVIAGVGDNAFAPKNTATREQALTIVVRLVVALAEDEPGQEHANPTTPPAELSIDSNLFGVR